MAERKIKMTIRERFAKYTTEELKENIARVEKHCAENKASMENFKAERNVEFYNVAKSLYENDIAILMDAQCALDARI